MNSSIRFLFTALLFSLSSAISVAEEVNSLQLAGHVFPTAGINLTQEKVELSKINNSKRLIRDNDRVNNQILFLETNFNSNHTHKISVNYPKKSQIKVIQKRIHAKNNKQIHFFKLSGLKKLAKQKITLVVMAN